MFLPTIVCTLLSIGCERGYYITKVQPFANVLTTVVIALLSMNPTLLYFYSEFWGLRFDLQEICCNTGFKFVTRWSPGSRCILPGRYLACMILVGHIAVARFEGGIPIIYQVSFLSTYLVSINPALFSCSLSSLSSMEQ